LIPSHAVTVVSEIARNKGLAKGYLANVPARVMRSIAAPHIEGSLNLNDVRTYAKWRIDGKYTLFFAPQIAHFTL
jgi:hypothetical protein